MCTGLLALCTCTHYQVLRYTTLCPLAISANPSTAPTPCALPTGRIQRTEFQCSGCDACDQAILNLAIDKDVALRRIEADFERKRAQAGRELEEESEIVRKFWLVGSLDDGQAERRIVVAEERERKVVEGALREMEGDEERLEIVFGGEVERIAREWEGRLRGMIGGAKIVKQAVASTGFGFLRDRK